VRHWLLSRDPQIALQRDGEPRRQRRLPRTDIPNADVSSIMLRKNGVKCLEMGEPQLDEHETGAGMINQVVSDCKKN
jgi:hypothetical protein